MGVFSICDPRTLAASNEVDPWVILLGVNCAYFPESATLRKRNVARLTMEQARRQGPSARMGMSMTRSSGPWPAKP